MSTEFKLTAIHQPEPQPPQQERDKIAAYHLQCSKQYGPDPDAYQQGVMQGLESAMSVLYRREQPEPPASGLIDQFTRSVIDKVQEGYVQYVAEPDQPSLDPKGAAGKLKPQLQLIPPIINVEMAKAIKHGLDKYGPWNWRGANVESMTYVGAIRRHLDAYLDGQDLDESGAHHLGHIAASCAILLDAARHGTLVDNRPPTPAPQP